MPVVPRVLALHQEFLSPPGEQGSCGALSHPAGGIFMSVSVLHCYDTILRQLLQMGKEIFARPMVSNVVS